MNRASSARHITLAEEVVVGTAFHEAGHVVALWHFLGEVPELVTIEEPSEVLAEPTWGFMRRRGTRLPPDLVRSAFLGAAPEHRKVIKKATEAEAMVDLAGPAVDAMLAPEDEMIDASDRLDDHDVEGGDTAHALERLSALQENEGLRWRWLHRLFKRMEKVVRRPEVSDAISEMAEALLDKPTLNREALSPLLAHLSGRGVRR